ncbi:outer membrane porin, OprD family [Pseudomonas daroniae]|uniref:Outer membrane porin, OprD family n=1 Tax=Phytopseudomonas daroniae TaxID=2487519 RepID=A0A4Q9QIT5_9GAMM|nr:MULTISPECIES: OprD family porin [Pseudomonas]TBU71695.1 outer membrane porin, OprD family [Pseudomonas daroniae]TBU76511.1 outer membrane porin, OprD family [Pseudomonas daroniae]TBU80944.1 outer membrane porin, OprD family [Pseudomonas sp. FRB 228]TBU90182.1 outer membrane porin, OprD family [Pseudomonas daroniae]
MRVMKWSVIALAVAAGTSQMAVASSQSESNGFIEDSSFNIFNRALYFNRDFRNAAPGSQSYTEETGLGIRLLYESGFTQGTVGFGFDAHSLSSIKIDSGRGRHSTGQFGTTSDGRGEDTQSEVGGAIKLRLSDTVLKYGSQFTSSPVFATDDSRILPEVATGTLLTSNEIEGLELTAGRFTAMSSQVGSGRDGINGKGEQGLTSANIVGASYSFTDNFSGAIHHSDVEDFFKKTYVNLNYNLPLSDEQALNFDFNAYKTSGDGEERYGEVDNKIWSLAAAYSLSAHTFTVAHQRSSGDAGYAYGVDGGGTVFLANSVQMRDFNGKDEKSWQARYDLDLATFGVPGLSFMARYITGSDIDVGPGSDLSRWERNIEAKYVVQDGAAKDLSFRVRQATYRADAGYEGGKLDEVRLIVEYPLSVL